MKRLTSEQIAQRRAWGRAWYAKNKEKRRAANRRYAAAHRAELNARQRAYYKTRAQAYRDYATRKNKQLKLTVLTHYGGSPPMCSCCGETTLEFLTIDHIHLDGASHRRDIFKGSSRGGGNAAYRWLIRNKFPTGFRVLCWNCNCGSFKHAGVCPHEIRRRHAEAANQGAESADGRPDARTIPDKPSRP